MKLVSHKQITEKMYQDYLDAWSNEKMVPYAVTLRADNFEAQMKRWDFEATDGIKSEGFVPSELYFLLDQEEIVGAIHLRLELNDSLLQHGGHIGYGVKPSCRKKGYADYMMEALLEKLVRKGISRVLVTCDTDNIGSSRVIEKHGGKLENHVMYKGVKTSRYWIEL